jgi:hypothetical protein
MLIGTRLLRMRTGDIDTDVAIRLFMPEASEDLWWCRYEIDWPNGKTTAAAAGADSIQSIVLALQKSGVEIYTSEHHKSGNLAWSAPGQGYGFPVSENAQELSEGADATLGMGEPKPQCSFCGKGQHEVLKIIAGPEALVCNERVALCVEVIGTDHPEWLEQHKRLVGEIEPKRPDSHP